MSGGSETLQAIIDASDEQVFALDAQGRYLAFNRAHAAAMRELYGIAIAAGHRQTDPAIPAADREAALADHERTLAGECFAVSASLGQNGQKRYYEIVHTPRPTRAAPSSGSWCASATSPSPDSPRAAVRAAPTGLLKIPPSRDNAS